jgi:hypothetical protein
VLSTSFGVSPTLALKWNSEHGASETVPAETTQATH